MSDLWDKNETTPSELRAQGHLGELSVNFAPKGCQSLH